MLDTSYPYGHGSGNIETDAPSLSIQASRVSCRNGQATPDANPFPHGHWTTSSRSSAFAADANLLLDDQLARWLAQ